jgi:hypothetical protein
MVLTPIDIGFASSFTQYQLVVFIKILPKPPTR